MIDEKKLIDDLMGDSGIKFEVTVKGTSPKDVANAMQEYGNKMIQAFVDLIKSQHSYEWISVNDRLPETPGGWRSWVIVHIKGYKHSAIRQFERTRVRGKIVERFKYPWDRISYEEITHWMPLPEPPKDGEP